MTGTDYGCSTLCCLDIPLDEALGFLREKTGRIEIMSEGRHDLFLYREACESVDARYSVHAPISDLNLASTNDRIRHAAIAVIDDLCGICDEIRAGTLVVHPGYFPWPFMKADAEKNFIASLDALSAVQNEHEVTIGIENMGAWECLVFRSPELVPAIRNRGLGFVLDFGHANINGNPAAFVIDGKPCHVHLHDNFGKSDEHAPCGTGSIDFAGLLRLLPKTATRIIECTNPDGYEKSVQFLSRIDGTGSA
ncbi:MAG: sugar phosphate isomerase/epimerase family protein [Methanoregula sp.]|jgi:sugar phosphate isomerase/epimerase